MKMGKSDGIKTRLLWIDLAKFVSIAAVIIGHLFGIIYTDPIISGLVAYSVTLFIILAGYNSALSFENVHIPTVKYDWRYLWGRLKKILVPYFSATLIYHLYSSNYEFILPKFLEKLYLFNSRPIFYFVFVYVQLLIIAPLIIKYIVRRNILFQVTILVLIYYISTLFTSRTFTIESYGGGRNLLGGTYLFAFTLGVFLYDRLKLVKKNNIIGLWLLTIFLGGYFISKEMYGSTFSNPPNIFLLFYSLIIFLFIFLVGNYLEKKPLSFLFKPFAFLGRYSLYIYFYHIIAIEVTTEILIRKGLINPAIQNYFYFLFALLFPILMVKFYDLLVFLTKLKISGQSSQRLDLKKLLRLTKIDLPRS